MPLRILFDRSAFHGPSFNQLRDSALQRAVTTRKIIVHHTPILLEETLNMYGRERHLVTLREQLPFIFGLCNGDWLRNKEEIWHEELVQNRGAFAKAHWRPRLRDQIQAKILADVSNEGRYWQDFVESAPLREDTQKKKSAQQDVRRLVRDEVSEKLKGIKRLNERVTYAAFESYNLDFAGQMILERFLPEHLRRDRMLMWTRYRHRYPYITAFVRGFLYDAYFSAVERNAGLDRNAQADYEQLAYLNHADIFVTAETGFLMSAFNTLWHPAGKTLFSPRVAAG